MTRSKGLRVPPPDYPPGTRFGLVTVVRREAGWNGRAYRVRCDCGVEREVLACSLRATPPRTHRMCDRRGAA